MKALIIIAHGSRKELSNSEFTLLVKKFKKMNNSFSEVEEAFLEIAEPSISDVIENLNKKNIKEIIIYPYFLNQGKHVLIDIPNKVREEENKYQDIEFKLLPHFGSSLKIFDIIENDVEC